jgi:hypothetical protein
MGHRRRQGEIIEPKAAAIERSNAGLEMTERSFATALRGGELDRSLTADGA